MNFPLGKDFYKSKTLWIAALQFTFGGFVLLQSEYPEVGAFLLAKSILDVLIRFLTTESIR